MKKSTHEISKFYLLSISLCLCSCETCPMREITARNNGVRFWMHSASWLTGKWDYEGGANQANEANGFGKYRMTYGDIHSGSGNFINGKPDGVHTFSNELVAGTNVFSNGRLITQNKERDDVGKVLLDSALAAASVGMTAVSSPDNKLAPGTSSASSLGPGGTQNTSGPWYPVTYKYGQGEFGMYINGRKYNKIIWKPGGGSHWGKPG